MTSLFIMSWNFVSESIFLHYSKQI